MPQIEDMESATTSTTPSTSWWNYGSAFLKGVGILAVGGLAYLGWRSYSQQTATSIAKAEQDALSVKSNFNVENVFSATSSDFSSQETLDLSYRHKRTTPSAQTAIGVEFQANTFIQGNQASPAIATLSNDNFVIVWSGGGEQDGSREGIFGQIFDHYGNKIGGEFQVNTYWADAQMTPEVAALNNTGGFTVVWQSNEQDGWAFGVFGQPFDSTGNKGNYTEFKANTYIPNDQTLVRVAALPSGRLLVAWSSLGEAEVGYHTVYGQLFDGSTQVGSEFAISSTNPSQDVYTTSLMALPNSNQFVMAWYTGGGAACLDTSGTGSEAQRVDAAGNKVGNRFLMNTYTPGWQYGAKLAAFAHGGFVATWISENQVSTSSGHDIYAQRFDASSNQVGYEFLVNTYTIGNQISPSVVVLSDDSFFIAWQSLQDGSGYGIYAQWFNANGAKLGREFQVNAYIQDEQVAARGARFLNDNIAFTWQSMGQDGSGYGVFARILKPSLLPFVYNLDIPQQYLQNTLYVFQNLVVNPMVDANVVNVTLTMDPSKGSLNTPNSSTFYYGNASSTYDANTGIWFVSGAVVPVNNILSNLTFTPVAYGFGDFNISFNVVDGVHSNFAGSLLMHGLQVPYPPILQVQHFVVDQGIPQTLTLNDFNASNPDPQVTRNLSFAFDQVLQTSFINTETGQGVFNVSDAEINQGVIRLMPDDSGFPVSFRVTASDGISTSLTLPANITFNQRPLITTNSFPITSNSQLILGSANLNGTDDYTTWLDLVWQLSDMQHAQLQGASQFNATYTFTNRQLVNSTIVLVPDGSSNQPTFGINLLDARNLGLKQVASSVVNFQYISPEKSTNTKTNNNNLVISLGAGIGGGVLLTAGALTFGIFAHRRHKKANANGKGRAAYPLANALYEALKIKGVEDFSSNQGAAFLNAVNALNAELQRTGVDTQQMVPEERDELAEVLARAIQANVEFESVSGGVKLNSLDIQDRAPEIVKMTKSLGRFTYQNGQTVEMVNLKR